MEAVFVGSRVIHESREPGGRFCDYDSNIARGVLFQTYSRRWERGHFRVFDVPRARRGRPGPAWGYQQTCRSTQTKLLAFFLAIVHRCFYEHGLIISQGLKSSTVCLLFCTLTTLCCCNF